MRGIADTCLDAREATDFGLPTCSCGAWEYDDIRFQKKVSRKRKVTSSISMDYTAYEYFCLNCGESFVSTARPEPGHCGDKGGTA